MSHTLFVKSSLHHIISSLTANNNSALKQQVCQVTPVSLKDKSNQLQIFSKYRPALRLWSRTFKIFCHCAYQNILVIKRIRNCRVLCTYFSTFIHVCVSICWASFFFMRYIIYSRCFGIYRSVSHTILFFTFILV